MELPKKKAFPTAYKHGNRWAMPKDDGSYTGLIPRAGSNRWIPVEHFDSEIKAKRWVEKG